MKLARIIQLKWNLKWNLQYCAKYRESESIKLMTKGVIV